MLRNSMIKLSFVNKTTREKEEYLFNTVDDATFFLTALRKNNYEKAHMEEIRGLF